MSSSSHMLYAAPSLALAQENQTLPRSRCRPPFTGKETLNRRIALFPIVFFELYLSFTVFLFAFGPWPWPVSNPIELYGFLALAQLGLLVGYLSAIHQRPRVSSVKWRPSRLVVLSLLFNFAWLIQSYKDRTNSVEFSFAQVQRAISTGLSDPAVQYNARLESASALGPSSIITYVSLLLTPILFILLPVGVVYWQRLSWWTRIGMILWAICDLMTWVATGTNKGIADYALLLPWLLVAREPSVLATVKWRKVLVIASVTLVGITTLLILFSMNMISRVGEGGGARMRYDPDARITLDAENPLIRFLPPAQQGPIAMFISYESQGYYGLSLALRESFVPCYGLGNSFFLEGLSRKYVANSIADRTYPGRIEQYGWGQYLRWHTLYPWIASDVSFYGTIVVMFLIGRLLALVWLDVVFYKDPFAVSLFALLVIMLYYTPANNQVLGFSPSAVPFWAFLFIWRFSRGRRRGAPTKYA